MNVASTLTVDAQPTGNTKFCPKCGGNMSVNAEACPACGAPQPGTTPSAEVSPKGFVPALVLCILLGGLGVHRFYLGKPISGIFMILTLGGFGIWALIDLIRIAVGSFNDGDGLPVKSS